jgi:hypothetical protein
MSRGEERVPEVGAACAEEVHAPDHAPDAGSMAISVEAEIPVGAHVAVIVTTTAEVAPKERGI